MHPHEIASCLEIDGGAKADPASVLCCLKRLSSQGIFTEAEGAFLPTERLGGLLPDELTALRLVHDSLLERGIPFARKKVVGAGNRLEISVFSGKGSVLDGMKKGVVRLVVFPREGERERFEQSLQAGGREEAMIAIAMENGAIALADAKRSEIEPYLP